MNTEIKKWKRLISAFLAFVLLFTSVPLVVLADTQDAHLTAATVNGNRGGLVAVDINLTRNEIGVSGLQYRVGWNPAHLELVTAAPVTPGLLPVTPVNVNNNPMMVVQNNPLGPAGIQHIYGTGTVATLHFRVLPGAPLGLSPVTVETVNVGGAGATPIIPAPRTHAGFAGGVMVEEALDDVHLSVAHASGNQGQYVDVPINLTINRIGVSGLQYRIGWDATRLELAAVNPVTPGLLPVTPVNVNNNPMMIVQNNPLGPAGIQHIYEYGPTAAVATLRFRILPNAELGATPVTIEAINAGGAGETPIIPAPRVFSGSDGSVTIGAAQFAVTVNGSHAATTGAGNYAANDTVTIHAGTHPQGHTFAGWTTSDGVTFADATQTTTTFTMPAQAVTVTANWTPLYAVTVNGSHAATTGAGNYAANDTVTIHAGTHPQGRTFAGWTTSDGVTFADATQTTTTFTMPAQAVTVTANWTEVFAVTVNGSHATETGAGDYAANETVTIHAGTRTGYRFTGWTTSDGVTFADATQATTTFTMPAQAVTVTATWATDFDLDPGMGGIYGYILRDENGAPLAGAVVVIRNAAGAVVLSTITSADGSYEVLNIAPGNYTIAVSRAGYFAQSRTVAVVADQMTRADFRLVVDPASDPNHYNLIVTVLGSPATAVTTSGGNLTQIGTTGVWQLHSAAPQTGTVTASAPGYDPVSAAIPTPDANRVSRVTLRLHNFDLDPGMGGIFGDVLRAADHTAVAGATVIIRNAATGATVLNTVTGADGFFYVTNIVPGNYEVTVIRAGYIAQTRTVAVVADEMTYTVFYLVSDPTVPYDSYSLIATVVGANANTVVAGANSLTQVGTSGVWVLYSVAPQTGTVVATAGTDTVSAAIPTPDANRVSQVTLTFVLDGTPIITVGAQNAIMVAGIPSSVTFPVTTTNIPPGIYSITVNNLPTGVTAQGTLTIGSVATLTLVGGTNTIAGVYNTLTLSIPTLGVTSAPFTLTIITGLGGGTPPLQPPTPPTPPQLPGIPGTPGTPYIPWAPRVPGAQLDAADGVLYAEYETIDFDQAPELAPVAPMPVREAHHAFMIGFAEDGTIRPHANITRAEVTTIFFRLITDQHRANIWSQTNSFADVPRDRWFNNPISTMQNGGLFAGIPLGYNFNPNQAATRAEFAAMVVNYLGLGHYRVTNGGAFTDIAGHWASDAINVAYLQGWVRGFGDGTFRPDQLITRAEVAALVNRALGRLPQTAGDLLPGMIMWPDNMNQNAWYFLYIQEATNSHHHQAKADGVHETWTHLIDPRNWRALERPNSMPWDILNQ